MGSFVHPVLVELRARLRASADPDRILRVTTELARQAGLVECAGCWTPRRCRTRSPPRTPSPWLRGAVRGLLGVCPAELAGVVRAAFQRDEDYQAAGKPVWDWDDPQARE